MTTMSAFLSVVSQCSNEDWLCLWHSCHSGISLHQYPGFPPLLICVRSAFYSPHFLLSWFIPSLVRDHLSSRGFPRMVHGGGTFSETSLVSKYLYFTLTLDWECGAYCFLLTSIFPFSSFLLTNCTVAPWWPCDQSGPIIKPRVNRGQLMCFPVVHTKWTISLQIEVEEELWSS